MTKFLKNCDGIFTKLADYDISIEVQTERKRRDKIVLHQSHKKAEQF